MTTAALVARNAVRLLLIIGTGCGDPDKPIRIEVADGAGKPPPPPAVDEDLGNPDGSCGCKVTGANITTSLACYCKGQPGCAEGIFAERLASLEMKPPRRCGQVRGYSCGLDGIGWFYGYALNASIDFYDSSTGKLVGMRIADDIPVGCPGQDGSRGSYLFVGRVPGARCLPGACQEICPEGRRPCSGN